MHKKTLYVNCVFLSSNKLTWGHISEYQTTSSPRYSKLGVRGCLDPGPAVDASTKTNMSLTWEYIRFHFSST